MIIHKYLIINFTSALKWCTVILMKINKGLSDSDILIEIGKRIKSARIRRSYTQAQLAEISGVSKGTVANIESGESVQFGTILKILRELDCLNALELLLPSSESSPMELIHSKYQHERQRVRSVASAVPKYKDGWKWGEDE